MTGLKGGVSSAFFSFYDNKRSKVKGYSDHTLGSTSNQLTIPCLACIVISKQKWLGSLLHYGKGFSPPYMVWKVEGSVRADPLRKENTYFIRKGVIWGHSTCTCTTSQGWSEAKRHKVDVSCEGACQGVGSLDSVSSHHLWGFACCTQMWMQISQEACTSSQGFQSQ